MFIMMADILIIAAFVGYNLMAGKRKLIHWLYAAMSVSLIVWQLSIIAMKLVDPADNFALFLCDAFSNIGVAFTPVATLFLAIAFTQNLDKLPRKFLLLLIPPLITVLVVFTNPLHHLQYRVFSVIASEIVFGPYIIVTGLFSYACLTTAMVVSLRYGLKSRHGLYLKQSMMFTLSILAPLLINILATLQLMDLSIAATPLAFLVTVIAQGGAIYYLDFLNIEPLALVRVLDSISDCYAVVSDEGRVVSYNKPFGDVFTPLYDLKIGASLYDVASRHDDQTRGTIYNLITSIESARNTRGVITYEQTMLTDKGMNYYAVEITPLIVSGDICGFIAMLKDVTRLREVMLQEQDNLSRSMERERLASLGQMIGGIAHNLKTPIMSIAGSVGVLDKLAHEYDASIGDPDVTAEDHKEIYGEMVSWLGKIQSCCAYMSDIITTVKGLATNMSTSVVGEFGVDELHKRVFLLMQHDLKRGNCTLTFDNELPGGVLIRGDINNLVQVLNNLVGNAVDAMESGGGGTIALAARMRDNSIVLSVADEGPGIPPDVRDRLFKEMYTSKGTKGTGLGLYISNVLMHGKFGGSLWLEDTQKGATFSLSIPLQTPDEDGQEQPVGKLGGIADAKE